jgi:glycosyltransferase involved in cell wall biosynthesis
LNIAILGIKQIPATAGADRVVEKLLENFATSHHYWVYVRADGASDTLGKENIHLIPIRAPKGKHIGSFFFFLFSSLHFVLRGHFDLAHVHNSDFGIFTLLLRLKPGVPVLGTFHGDPYVRQKWGKFARLYLRMSERFFVQFADRLTSVSKFKSTGHGFVNKTPIDYIPNGIDPHTGSDYSDLPAIIAELDDYYFFACGRLDSTKGLHHLLKAYTRFDTSLKLLVVGDFSHDPGYSQEVDRLIAADGRIIAYRDLLPRSQLLKALSDCRLFFFPSEYEAMSMILLEAVSCRTPVICTDILPNLEVVGESYAYAYPAGDIDALVEMMQQSIRESEWVSITSELYERCSREFNWSNIAASYQGLYAEMVVCGR